MNAVCTIVAKNYFSQAKTLVDSIKRIHKNDLKIHILIADEFEGIEDRFTNEENNYEILEFKKIGLPFWEDMAFKYDIVEFCTATKPFFIDYLMETYSYEKIIYLDPDIVLYDKLDYIFDLLNNNCIVLTPHAVDPCINVDNSYELESKALGIFNLGFVAFNNSKSARMIIDWWKVKLKDSCYIDFEKGLFVDQKWMDFIPSFLDIGIFILRDPGYNMARWNFHERELIYKDGKYFVKRKSDNCVTHLVFFHFSGYNPNNIDVISKNDNDSRYISSEIKEIFSQYANTLLNNGFNEYVKMMYTYSYFKNGLCINTFQRRLYRVLFEKGIKFNNLFSVERGSYYKFLEKNKLLIYDKTGEFNKLNLRNYPKYRKKELVLNKIMRFLKMVIGIKNYILLLKYFRRCSRIDDIDIFIKILN